MLVTGDAARRRSTSATGSTMPHYHFSVKFVFDRLSVPFVILSFVLCGTIGAFASRYLHREPGFNRFFVLYALFVLGMVLTSLAGTIETLFAGWELVGLSSALLVAFFQERPAPVRNGLRVWIVYRVSDAALLLAAVVLHHLRGEGDFDELLGAGPWPDGHAALTALAGAARRPAAAGGRRGQVGAGAVLRLAAAGDGRADAVERRVLRRPVGPPGGVPAAAGQPDPRSFAVVCAVVVRAGLGDRRCWPRWPAACRPTSSGAVVRLADAGRHHRGRDRLRACATSPWSISWDTPACGRCSSCGLRRCCRTTASWKTPSATALPHRRAAAGTRACRRTARAWWYRFALERGYLDALLSDYVARPFLSCFALATRWERRWTDLWPAQPSRESDQLRPSTTLEELR